MKTLIDALEGLPKRKLDVLKPKLRKIYLQRRVAVVAKEVLVSENKDLQARLAKARKEMDQLRNDLENERLKAFDFISPDFEDSFDSEDEEPEKPKEPEDKDQPEPAQSPKRRKSKDSE